MGNISALSQGTTAATALSNLILVTPQKTIGYQPQNPPVQNGSPTQPPPALLFHYEGDQASTLQSDITDHYIEDNTALQDQIALKPPQITTHGFIGELNNVPPTSLAAVQTVADKLTVVGAYTPALSASALLAYNEAFQLYQVGLNAVNSGVSAWNSVNSTGGESVIGASGALSIQPSQTKQQQMYQQLYGYWQNRILFTVQTPWAVFQNMAIESITAVQDGTTIEITDFNLTFKQIRMATTQTPGQLVSDNMQNRASIQGSGLVNLGTSTPSASIPFSSGLSAFPAVA